VQVQGLLKAGEPRFPLQFLQAAGTLQVADAVTGPYVDIAPVAASPYVLGTTGAGKFYRLKR